MKTFTRLTCALSLSWLLPISPLMADSFISQKQAENCVEISKASESLKVNIHASETKKAEIKSKINYLAAQIKKRRNVIEGLDQQHNQVNNKNYNQLIDKFEALRDERKETITLYNDANIQHLKQYEQLLDLQQSYENQCLDNIQISKGIFRKVCEPEKTHWCELFSF